MARDPRRTGSCGARPGGRRDPMQPRRRRRRPSHQQRGRAPPDRPDPRLPGAGDPRGNLAPTLRSPEGPGRPSPLWTTSPSSCVTARAGNARESLWGRRAMRAIGIDLGRRVAAVAVCEEGEVHAAGTLPVTRESLAAYGASLGPDDALVVEATLNTWAVVDLLAPRAGRVVVANPRPALGTGRPTRSPSPTTRPSVRSRWPRPSGRDRSASPRPTTAWATSSPRAAPSAGCPGTRGPRPRPSRTTTSRA